MTAGWSVELAFLCVVVATFGVLYYGHVARPKVGAIVRGGKLTTSKELKRAMRRLQSAEGPMCAWCGELFPLQELDPHFVVVGVPGAGKTLMLRMLMGSVLPNEDGPTSRALVLDPKRDMVPVLLGMGLTQDRVHILNPFDARASAWDMAADVTSDANAQQLAAILIPTTQAAKEPYFDLAAQRVVTELLNALRRRKASWGLLDLVQAATSKRAMEAVLSETGEGRDVADTYLHQGETTSACIVSTIDSRISRFRIAARLWSGADRKVSLAAWLKSDAVLVLGTDKEQSEALGPIHRAMFRRAAELVTSRVEEAPKDTTWFFLDELRFAGVLDGLLDLLVVGRSKGVHVALGFQDLAGLEHVYGREQARELLGLAGNVAVLRLNNPDTMEWASRYFGVHEVPEAGLSEQWNAVGLEKGRSAHVQLQQRKAMLEAEFRAFRKSTKERGIEGSFVNPAVGAWLGRVRPEFLEVHLHELSSQTGFERRGDLEALHLARASSATTHLATRGLRRLPLRT